MTDYEEEQSMEVEALESIYMDEFTKLSDAPLSYKILLEPYQDGTENLVSITLKCTIPAQYPDESPEIEIVVEKGLSDIQKQELANIVSEQVRDNEGMAMIFTICEALKEYLVENNREGNDGSEYQQMMRRMEKSEKKAAEEERIINLNKVDDDEPRKVEGTLVTVESFNEWKKKFDKEMRAQRIACGGIVDVDASRLTGRQLWNQTHGTGKIQDDEMFDDEEGEIDEEEGMGDDDEEYDDEDDDDDDDDDDQEEYDHQTDSSRDGVLRTAQSLAKAKISQ